jgi:hypothetical protein
MPKPQARKNKSGAGMGVQRTRGTKAKSEKLTPVQADILQSDHTLYEGKITMLFTPWIVSRIPDAAWQTLQEKLGYIVREMLSVRNMKVKKYG